MTDTHDTIILASCQFLPTAILRRLRGAGMHTERILIAAEGDLSTEGWIVPVWLVVGEKHVCGVPAESAFDLRGPFSYDDVDAFDLRGTVGSTSLRAVVHGAPIDLVRFTNEYRERFSRVVAQLQRLRESRAIDPEALLALDPRLCPKCQMILEQPGTTCPRCVQNKALVARLLTMLKPYAFWVCVLLVLMLSGIAFDLLPPFLMRFLVDDVLQGDRPDLLGAIVAALAAAGLGRCVINILISRLSSRVGTEMTRNMRLELFAKLEDMSVAYYDRMQVGGLMTRVVNDAEVLQAFVQQAAQGFLVNILLVVGIGVMMFYLNARLAMFVMLPIPVIVLGTLIFRTRIRPWYFRLQDSVSKTSAMLNGVLSGIRLVKAFGQEERELTRFAARVNSRANAVHGVNVRAGGFQAAMAYVFMLPALMIWYFGGRDVLAGGGVSLGVLMAFLGYLGMFYGPLQSLALFANWFTQFLTGTQRVFEILDTPPEVTDKKDALLLEELRGDIEFDDVTFGYDPYSPVIKNVSLEIRAGERIGIVGKSGSGKSTLISLLCRFYDVQKGAVRIDGRDVRDLRRNDLRRHVGLVLQEPFLFRASIAENIAYGRPDATMREIMEAARAANCHDFILQHAQGYDTRLGEHGAGLSGGERQRLSIARAILCDPRVLILDEATSSVDTESEQEIQKALERLARDRTTISIAHRLTTLRNADRIYVVDAGRIVECGTHEELMREEGTYWRLVKIQTELATLETV